MTTPLKVTVEDGLEAAMRDGTVLRADLYRPAGAGPWPVLLARTPYGTRDAAVLARLDPVRAAGRGRLVVIQDCRGRFASDGIWEPVAHEASDGYDSVAWAARLPGADGRVAMYGPSYLGHAQWAAIGAAPPGLYAAVPEFTWSDPHDGLVGRGGAYELGLVTQWTLSLGVEVVRRRWADRPRELERQLALVQEAVDHAATRTYFELPGTETWALRRLGLPVPTPAAGPAAPAGVPTLVVAGWFDAFLQGSLDNHVRARTTGVPASLIVGPWSHGDQGRMIGGRDFGAPADAAALDGGASLLDRELDWLERCPRDGAAGMESSVLVFVMGTDEWRGFEAWPPESVAIPWYLHPEGRLSVDLPPASGRPDGFRHSFDDPVPTHGGAVLLSPEFPAGSFDQREIEARADVLVYTSESLSSPLEVIGRVRVRLVAESSASVTDWVVRLCDVDEDGVSWNIADGILRVRDADRVAEHVIDLWSTAYVFRPGHQVRLQVASSCFPRWDRAADARQRVFHDAVRASRIVLPVAGHDGRRAATIRAL